MLEKVLNALNVIV